MAENSHIQWCDATINMWWGCTKISPGCAHCYADSLAHRWGKDVWGTGKPREDHREGATKLALRLNKQAEKAGRRLRVFSASMSDWLDEEVPIEWVADLLALIHATPNLDWLLLTKRPENWRSRIEQAEQHMLGGDFDSCVRGGEFDSWLMATGWMTGDAPANVWMGTTVEDRVRAEERIPALLRIPARVRFLSCEPLLEEVRLIGARETLPHEFDATGMAWSESNARYERLKPAGIDWVICGGESGAGARAMEEGWARSLREQCRAAGVAFFMKQLGGRGDARGELEQLPADLRVREFPAAVAEVAR